MALQNGKLSAEWVWTKVYNLQTKRGRKFKWTPNKKSRLPLIVTSEKWHFI